MVSQAIKPKDMPYRRFDSKAENKKTQVKTWVVIDIRLVREKGLEPSRPCGH